ncbi:Hypotetical protein [Gulosibacter molinativorax]|nr:Hypotetical protein [Gulosibacter molinativorax]
MESGLAIEFSAMNSAFVLDERADHRSVGGFRNVRGCFGGTAEIEKAPGEPGAVVAPTGVDPVTSRFSVVRSTN